MFIKKTINLVACAYTFALFAFVFFPLSANADACPPRANQDIELVKVCQRVTATARADKNLTCASCELIAKAVPGSSNEVLCTLNGSDCVLGVSPITGRQCKTLTDWRKVHKDSPKDLLSIRHYADNTCILQGGFEAPTVPTEP